LCKKRKLESRKVAHPQEELGIAMHGLMVKRIQDAHDPVPAPGEKDSPDAGVAEHCVQVGTPLSVCPCKIAVALKNVLPSHHAKSPLFQKLYPRGKQSGIDRTRRRNHPDGIARNKRRGYQNGSSLFGDIHGTHPTPRRSFAKDVSASRVKKQLKRPLTHRSTEMSAWRVAGLSFVISRHYSFASSRC
jgi:hypothetical protein